MMMMMMMMMMMVVVVVVVVMIMVVMMPKRGKRHRNRKAMRQHGAHQRVALHRTDNLRSLLITLPCPLALPAHMKEFSECIKGKGRILQLTNHRRFVA